jgi:hypothetical protein
MFEDTLKPLPRVVITGSRAWTDTEFITRRLLRLHRAADGPLALVHGCAKGADEIAGAVAEQLGWRVERHPALWEDEGRGAGHKRNIRMLDHPRGTDLVIAFATDIKTSKGTRHCALAAHERKIALEINQPGKPMQRFYWPPLIPTLNA